MNFAQNTMASNEIIFPKKILSFASKLFVPRVMAMLHCYFSTRLGFEAHFSRFIIPFKCPDLSF